MVSQVSLFEEMRAPTVGDGHRDEPEAGQSIATTSHHLSKLRLAGLVDARRQGKRQIYVAADRHVVTVVRLAIEERLKQPQTTRRARRA
jgi:DNA-binding transcriptional ArsR family regulator